MARSLKRNVVSMLSPKNDVNKFKINLNFGNQWLDGFPDANQILNIAPYKYTALLDEDYNLTVDYSFSLELNNEFGSREIDNKTDNIRGLLIPVFRKELEEENYIEDDIEKFIAEFQKQKNSNSIGGLEFLLYNTYGA